MQLPELRLAEAAKGRGVALPTGCPGEPLREEEAPKRQREKAPKTSL